MGFVYQKAVCSGFKKQLLGDQQVDVPKLVFGDDTILGKDCVWILPSEVQPGETPEQLHKKVYELNERVCEIAEELGKIKDEHALPFLSQSDRLSQLGEGRSGV